MVFKKKRKDVLLPWDRILSDRTSFPVREAFNTLRTNLIFALAPTEGKIVLVSSASAAECKSTTAVNLAISLAQNDSKVLLIDADLRKPTQHVFFKVNYTHGLSRFLVGFETFAEAVCRDVLPNLDFMPSGVVPPNPSELLGSERMKIFLEKMNEYYDYIIIDTPPINLVTDAAVLSQYTSGVLFVVRYGTTTYEDLRRAISAIEGTGTSILGFTLAEVPPVHNRYYSGKYYRREDKPCRNPAFGKPGSGEKWSVSAGERKTSGEVPKVTFAKTAVGQPKESDITEVDDDEED